MPHRYSLMTDEPRDVFRTFGPHKPLTHPSKTLLADRVLRIRPTCVVSVEESFLGHRRCENNGDLRTAHEDAPGGGATRVSGGVGKRGVP
jgi:hypothetical protein